MKHVKSWWTTHHRHRTDMILPGSRSAANLFSWSLSYFTSCRFYSQISGNFSSFFLGFVKIMKTGPMNNTAQVTAHQPLWPVTSRGLWASPGWACLYKPPPPHCKHPLTSNVPMPTPFPSFSSVTVIIFFSCLKGSFSESLSSYVIFISLFLQTHSFLIDLNTPCFCFILARGRLNSPLNMLLCFADAYRAMMFMDISANVFLL